VSLSDFETKVYELNYQRNEQAHELRWKFMYVYVAGSLTFWGLVFTVGHNSAIPVWPKLLPVLFALFGWASYHALRQNMRVRGQVMQELEDKAAVRGWQTLRREANTPEHRKLLVLFAHVFWVSMVIVSVILAVFVEV
jgi:hypothetical protein